RKGRKVVNNSGRMICGHSCHLRFVRSPRTDWKIRPTARRSSNSGGEDVTRVTSIFDQYSLAAREFAVMRVVTLGEVMLRLAPEEFLRVTQVLPGRLEATFGGGEVNVAVSIAMQGGEAAFATILPDNVLTDAFEQELRKLRVDPRLVKRSKQGRFGIYFVET